MPCKNCLPANNRKESEESDKEAGIVLFITCQEGLTVLFKTVAALMHRSGATTGEYNGYDSRTTSM